MKLFYNEWSKSIENKELKRIVGFSPFMLIDDLLEVKITDEETYFRNEKNEIFKFPEYTWLDYLMYKTVMKIKIAMVRRGVSQRELSKRLSKNETYMSKLLNNRITNVTITTLIEIAHVLNMEVSDLIKIEGDEKYDSFNTL